MENANIKIRLLKAVKKNIQGMNLASEHCNTTAICMALYNVSRNYKETEAADEIRDYIEKALGRNGYLTSWIRDNRIQYQTTPESMRQARIQWIDWMIEEYQKQVKK